MTTMRARTGKDEVTRWNVYWPLGGRGSGGKTQSLTFDNEDDAKKAKKIADRTPRHSLTYAQVLAEVYGEEIPAADVLTVAGIVEGFLDSLHDADSGTKARYRTDLYREVLPAVGGLAVDAVKPKHIDAIMTRLGKCDCDKATGERGPICSRRRQGRKEEAVNGHQGGLSKRRRDRYYNLMKGLFSYAVTQELCPNNPAKQINYKPQNLSSYHSGRKEDAHFYMTKDQYRLLREQFTPRFDGDPDYRLMLDFMVLTGARFSEATAAKVRAVWMDGDIPVLDIFDTWRQVEKEKGRRKFNVLEPKHGSNRSIEIEVELVETLAPLRAGRKQTDLIFCKPDGSRIDYDTFHGRWEEAVRDATRCPDHMPEPEGRFLGVGAHQPSKCGTHGGLNAKGGPCGQWVKPGWDRCPDHCGIPKGAESTCECVAPEKPKRLPKKPKIHDLRHTNVAWMVEGNVPLVEIAQRLGHSSTILTETVYAGLIKTPRSRARISSALSLR